MNAAQPGTAPAPIVLCNLVAEARGSFVIVDSIGEQQTQMPIPELERARVERALDKFCDRVPATICSELTYEYRCRDNTVVLRRPHFRDRTRHAEHLFAKFVYSPTVGGWSLRWSDRNGRWHAYQGV